MDSKEMIESVKQDLQNAETVIDIKRNPSVSAII